ncbi:ribosome maturation factor RimP [Sulfurospirillum arcachonense]|uniref:ribosome maturation factor RimP n=1 Tax=Sulfurospirillum arcachonense TaxID=57666 RepID=UPI00046891C9|nr:ribosome maturation factor RimP [Sulfurospirillum arcachonense]
MTTKETIVNILHDCDVELYDLETVSEFEQKIFRIYITSPEGISLDKCAEVTRILSPILDLEPPVNGVYTLEVSSPGIERPLKKIEHYKGSIGQDIKVKLINTDKIIGKLESMEDGKITIIEEDGEVTTLSLDDIEKARTYYKW